MTKIRGEALPTEIILNDRLDAQRGAAPGGWIHEHERPRRWMHVGGGHSMGRAKMSVKWLEKSG